MYSPKIREAFIPVLYRLSKECGKPMTVVVNEIIADALKMYEAEHVVSPDLLEGTSTERKMA
jgi:hypothetical protein